MISMPAEDARGPCWARYLAQLLWKKEELYLQLDSHMRFVPFWDRKARRDLLICQQKSQKPVLCCYGRAYQQGLPYDMAPKNLTGCLNCAAFFDAHNILNIRYRSLRHDWDEPRKSYFWSAHFSFSSSECLKEVPYDPRLLMLFFGEDTRTTTVGGRQTGNFFLQVFLTIIVGWSSWGIVGLKFTFKHHVLTIQLVTSNPCTKSSCHMVGRISWNGPCKNFHWKWISPQRLGIHLLGSINRTERTLLLSFRLPHFPVNRGKHCDIDIVKS